MNSFTIYKFIFTQIMVDFHQQKIKQTKQVSKKKKGRFQLIKRRKQIVLYRALLAI